MPTEYDALFDVYQRKEDYNPITDANNESLREELNTIESIEPTDGDEKNPFAGLKVELWKLDGSGNEKEYRKLYNHFLHKLNRYLLHYKLKK